VTRAVVASTGTVARSWLSLSWVNAIGWLPRETAVVPLSPVPLTSRLWPGRAEEGSTVLGGDADTVNERLKANLSDAMDMGAALRAAVTMRTLSPRW